MRFSKQQQLDADLVAAQRPCLFFPCVGMSLKLCRTRALMADVSYVCLSLAASVA